MNASSTNQERQAEIDKLKAEKEVLEKQLAEARQTIKDDLLFYDDACTYCLNPDIDDAWRHDHDGDGRFHWHHCLDPGDGLVNDCAHSEMYERIWQEAQAAQSETISTLQNTLREVRGSYELERHEELKKVRKRITDLYGGMQPGSVIWSNAPYDKGWCNGIDSALAEFDAAVALLRQDGGSKCDQSKS